MPLFFCHLRTHRGLEVDDTGTPFPDIEAAYIDVCRAIPEMVEELLAAGHDPLRCAFEIADECGRPLMDVPFSERLTRPSARPDRILDTRAMLDAVSRLSATAAERAGALHRSILEGQGIALRMAQHADASFLDRIAAAYGLDDAKGEGPSRRDPDQPSRKAR